MGLFSRKKIQATEGGKRDMDIVDGLTFAPASSTVPGVENAYRNYSSQVSATYRKYNGKDEWGNAQVRTIIDTRAAFIAGEGVSISTDDEQFAAWVKGLLKDSRLSGSKFFNLCMGTEMAGKVVLTLKRNAGGLPSIGLIGTRVVNGKAEVVDDNEIDTNKAVIIKTGGDGTDSSDTTTRIGLVLTDCESYDRALKDMRRSNYYGARLTPTWKTTTDQETSSLRTNLKTSGWKWGQGFVGTATLGIASPGTGASDNLKAELAAFAKTISSVTAVPVHWLGHTDLMSNRATADDLYQTISNGTSRERVLIAEGLYELIVKAQTMYIDAGGTDISAVNKNFSVSIPSVDYGKFESMVRALSLAYTDKIISADDYRSFIPGIDPLETKKALAEQAKVDVQDIIDSLDGAENVTGSEEETSTRLADTPVNSAPATEVQQTALNGAQIDALSSLARSVAIGELPKSSALAIARASFPTVKDDVLLSVFDSIKKGGSPNAS